MIDSCKYFCFTEREIDGIDMWRIIILYIVIGLTAPEKTFHNYKVFRITPTTNEHVKLLYQLDKIYNGFSFWKEPTSVNMYADLMVAPHNLPKFHELMAQIKAPYQVYVENVQTLVDRTKIKRTANFSFDFTSYHSLEEIYDNLDELAKQYSDKVKVIMGGRTYKKRPIKGVKVSFKAENPGIFIEGGIHAREWISPATVMYILHQLLTSNDQDVRTLAESHDWYLFPVFNPDGYVVTHTINRMWRKSCEPHRVNSTLTCRGTDLNRNWSYHWKSEGSGSIPCSQFYAGIAPLSTIEAKSMSEYIESIHYKFYAYISFHSYAQLLVFPYGYTKDHVENYDDLYAIGLKSIEALKKRYGTEYQIGTIADMFDLCNGNSADYIKGVYQKPIVYVYELRDKGQHGFLLPPEQIIPTGEETLDSLIAMFKEAKALGYPKKFKV